MVSIKILQKSPDLGQERALGAPEGDIEDIEDFEDIER